MTEEAARDELTPVSKPHSSLAANAITSIAWLLAAGALIFATAPQHETTANFTGHSVSAADVDTATPVVKPASAQTVSDPALTGAAAHADSSTTFDFIVKFNKDHPDLETCVKTFRTDKDAAKSIFAEWATDREAFQDIRLKKVSYSGEMILTWYSEAEGPLSKSDVEAKLAKIKSAPGVRYADKDSRIIVQKEH